MEDQELKRLIQNEADIRVATLNPTLTSKYSSFRSFGSAKGYEESHNFETSRQENSN